MTEPETTTSRPARRTLADRWGRTAIVGVAGIAGLVIIGTTALATGHADGATLGAIVAGITGCVGAVSGRAPVAGREA